MPSIPYQRHDEKPRDEEVADNPVEFVGSSRASPPGQPNVTHPIMPFETMEAMFATMKAMEAMIRYDKYANGAIRTMTGTGNSLPHSAQQSWVPPSDTQSTSRGGIPDQGPPLNQTPGPSSRPESDKGNSRANVQYDSNPRLIISDNFKPEVNNENSFNNNYYDRQVVNNNIRKGAKKGRRSKQRQEDDD